MIKSEKHILDPTDMRAALAGSPPEQSALLELNKVSIGYGRTRVVKDLNLSVAVNERLCLLGGNGSGKSTVLKCIAGLVRHWAGEILYRQEEIGPVDCHLRYSRGIVLVPQNRQLFAAKSVRENLLLACLSIGLSSTDMDARLDRAVAALPFLGDCSRKRAGLLSGGQQQIVALGRALMAEPKLLLMDEPSAGLAPVWIDVLEQGLNSIREHYSLTYILVEQNVNVGLTNSDRVSVLRNGNIALERPSAGIDNPDELFKAYLG